MRFQQALAWLDTFVNFERHHQPQAMRQVPLKRMAVLLERLGQPQQHFRSVVVTGTNGKGSICAALYSMLRQGSLPVGLYTSPHIESVRERIRVPPVVQAGDRRHADDWISERDFASVIEAVKPAVELLRQEWPDAPPTYFEVMTAVAFVYFKRRQIAIAVLEVGMGGRLDAVNSVAQVVSVIGPIDVDHAEVLGGDPVSIAREKAGIIKPGQWVISAFQREDVLEVLKQACEEKGSPLLVYGRDVSAQVTAHSFDGLSVSIAGLRGIYEDLSIPLIGRHQAENAALAVAALESLSVSGIPHTMVREGLAKISWPGRLEAVHRRPLVLMDGGHNPHAAAALGQTLRELCAGSRVYLLIGMSSDKPVEEIGRRLSGLPISATCTTSRHPRALNPVALAKRLAPFCSDVHVMSDPIDAYTYLLNAISSDDVIVVTGSFFLVGELRAALRKSDIRRRRKATEAQAV